MPTVINKHIGVSRDYSSPYLWNDDIPDNIVTADEVWIGHLHPEGAGTDGEWTGLEDLLHVGLGVTMDATRYVMLRAADGKSFRDSPNAELRYNPANGVALYFDDEVGGGTGAIRLQAAHARVSGLQASARTEFGAGSTIGDDSTHHNGGSSYIEGCLAVSRTNGRAITGRQVPIYNSIGIVLEGAGQEVLRMRNFFNNRLEIINCIGIAMPGTDRDVVFGNENRSQANYVNCIAIGNADTPCFNTPNSNILNCISTDNTAVTVGTDGIGNVDAADIFRHVFNDLRIKANSPSIEAGEPFTPHSSIPSNILTVSDIFRRARPQGAAWDIGPEEFVGGEPDPDFAEINSTDTVSMHSPATTTLGATVYSQDVIDLAVLESVALMARVMRADSLPVTAVDVVALLHAEVQRMDALGISAPGAGAPGIGVVSADALAVAVHDAAGMIAVRIIDGDHAVLGSSDDAGVILARLQASDLLALRAPGAASIAGALYSQDTAGIGIEAVAQILGEITQILAADSTRLSATESSTQQPTLHATDTLRLELIETLAVIFAQITAGDQASLGVLEARDLMVALEALDQVGISIDEQTTVPTIVVEVSDAITLRITETDLVSAIDSETGRLAGAISLRPTVDGDLGLHPALGGETGINPETKQ